MIASTSNSLAIVPWVVSHKKPPLPSSGGKSQSKRLKAEHHSRRILVVDDDIAVADSLAEILADCGYEALVFYDGYAAIDSAKTRCPDAVISDVVMPKLDGVDTAVAIRKLCPKTRIMLFSGQANITDILEKARAQGHKFELLAKPIQPDQLLKKLSRLDKS